MNQVEAQRKWYRYQFRTPLHEVLPQPIYRKQENCTWKECDVAKRECFFCREKSRHKPVGPLRPEGI